VIFSGGDPLSAPDRYLTKLVERIAEIEHVKIIRIHTRLPVMIPQRICPELLSWCTKTRLKIIMVLHINHPQELCTALKTQVAQLCAQQILVLNQSVLLKNINDCSQILSELSWKLFDANILPYYLHLLDPVQGSAHFGVATKEVQPLLQQLMTDLPGYLVPKVVREIPGAPYKVPACLSCTQALELPTLT
jgi:KamA family protein